MRKFIAVLPSPLTGFGGGERQGASERERMRKKRGEGRRGRNGEKRDPSKFAWPSTPQY